MKKQPDAVSDVSDDANDAIEGSMPYTVEVEVEGTSALLFHRYSPESVAEKSAAGKGSATSKTDDVESYVYRCDDGALGIPGENFRMSIVTAAKRHKDPSSPRKSAMDLFKAGVIAMTETATLGAPTWDYLDQRRVMIQRNAITRIRPAMMAGWVASFELQVLVPELIPSQLLNKVLGEAGRLVGVCDFRPTYGRFQINKFKVVTL